MVTLEASVEEYAESLSRLIDSLKSAQAELKELRRHQAALSQKLGDVGRVISFQPETDGTDHALVLLGWVMRAAEETVQLSEATLKGSTQAMPNLELRLRAMVDLINGLRATTTPAEDQPQRRAG